MAQFKVNYVQFRDELKKQADRTLQRAAFRAVKPEFDDAKEELIEKFENDKYSKEIAEHTAESPILGNKGTLFGFIGFDAGREPVAEVVADLKENIRIKSQPTSVRVNKSSISYFFQVVLPSMRELDNKHKMPKWSGLGWLSAIKKGISGFRSFIYWLELGRSNEGLQAKKKDGSPQMLREGSFDAAQTYLEDYLEEFKKKLE